MASVAELTIILAAKDSASKEIDGLGKSLGALGGLGKVAAVGLAGIATVGVGLAAGLGKSIAAAANFESAMSAVGAVSGASSTELASLSAKALQLGQDTRLAGIGATDAAAAMQALAAGGVSTEDILSGAAEGALLLASAGGIDVPRAAEIATNALNQFGLSGKDAGHVADLLAGAANASSADVSDLGESLKYVGPVAKSMGISIDDVVATLAEFGAQGIKGSQAGTSLRSIISSLAKPSKQAQSAMIDLGLSFFDAQGHMKDMGGISQELQTHLSGLTDQQRANALVTLFGNDALSAATVLYGQGADGLKQYFDQVTTAGSAAETGAKRNDNLRGSVEQLKSTLETASITLGTAFLPAVRGLVDTVAGAVNAAIPFIATYGPRLAATLQAGVTAVLGFGKDVASAIGAVVGSFLALRDGQITLDQFIGGLKVWVGQIFSNLGTLAAQIGTFLAPLADALWQWVVVAAPIVLSELGKLFAQLTAWITGTALPALAAAAGQLAGALSDWITTTAIPFLQTNLPIWGAALWGWITTTAVPAVVGAVGALASAMADWVLTTAIPYLQANLPVWGAALWDWITGTAVPAVVAAVGALASAMADWVVTTAIPYLQANLPVWGAALWGFITDTAVPTVIGAVVGLATAMSDWVETQAIPFLNAKLPIWGTAISDYITGTVVPTVTGAVVGIANAMSDWIETQAIPRVKEKLPGLTEAIIGQIQSSQEQVNVPIENMARAMGVRLGETLVEAGTAALTAAVSSWQTTLLTLMVTSLPNAIVAAGQVLGPKMAEWIITGALPEMIKNFAVFEAMAVVMIARMVAPVQVAALQIGIGVVQGILSGLESKAGELWAWLSGLPGRIAGAVGDLSSVLYAAGVSVVTGLVAGILSQAGSVASAAASLASQIPSSVGGLLGIKSPSKVMADIGNDVVAGLVRGMDEKEQEAAKKAADVASAVAKAITDTLAALTLLGKLNLGKLPTGTQSTAFLGALTSFMAQLAAVAGQFKDEVLKSATSFADTAGKAMGIAKTAVEALTAIGTFTAPLGSAVSAFLKSLTDFMEKFSTAAGGFEKDTLDDATAFADAAGKVGASVGNALKGLQDLASADWAKSSPTGGALGWFIHLTASLVQNFAAASKLFADDALAEASAFADAAGKVGGAVGNALKGLQDLANADWAKASPTGGTMGWFTHLVASLVQNFADAAKLFAADALTQANAFAESAGKVAGAIGPALTAFTALRTFSAPPQAAVDALLAGIRYIVARFGDMATTLSTEGVAQLGAFSDAAAKALGAAKTGIDTFKDFDKLVVPSKQAIDNLLIAIHYVVDQFGAMADSLATEGIARLQAFATAAGTALATAKAGTDLFKEMEKLSVPSQEAIDNLLAGIVYVVVRLGEIADQMNQGGIQKAQDFATGAKNIFDTLKAALDVLVSITKYKDDPANALAALKQGLENAIDEMRGRIGQAHALEQDADTFLGSMREAARKVAEGMALMGAATPPSGGNPATLDPNYRQPITTIIGVAQLASGGIVRKPTMALIGERGPEAVVPLGRGMAGGAVINNYYISGNTVLSKDTASQQALSGIVTTAQRRTIGYSI